MFEKELYETIERQLRMEKDHATMELLRSGAITGILNEQPGWRVNTPTTFACAETLQEAILKAVNAR